MTTSVELTDVDEASFDEAVLNADMPVLVDFWATWCPPCHPMARVLEQVAVQRSTVHIVKVNADDNPVIASRYRVMAMPTMMLFRAGVPVWSVVGARSKARLDDELDAALRSAD